MPKLTRAPTASTNSGGWATRTTSGLRSGLEERIAQEMLERRGPVDYETKLIRNTKPEKRAPYRPDFILTHNGIIIETKGRFLTADRQKMILVKDQHPDLDIRFLFSDASSFISKRSKTTYGMWAERHGFPYSSAYLPPEWLEEPPEERRMAALAELENA